MKYALAYNEFHNLESIGIKGKDEKLIKYAYKNGSGALKEITYANGTRMALTYDRFGRPLTERWYHMNANIPHASYRYAYDGDGNLVRSLDLMAGIEYTYRYEDGRIVEATEATVSREIDNIVARALRSRTRYTYGKEGDLLSVRTVDGDGEALPARILTPKENGIPTLTVLNGADTLFTSHAANDEHGRHLFDELWLGSASLSRRFTYYDGIVPEEHREGGKVRSLPTTQLVSRITLANGRTLSYEYDAEERITKVTDSAGAVTAYTYDALGQLLTETVNGVVVNSMTYDNYGNITAKNGKTYTYGNTAWRDLLTAYDGQSILYDAGGNPVTYLGHMLTWEKGRQLSSFGSYTYTYNANGIRTGKTVGGVLHTYTLDGARILRESWGENTLIPLYDNEDSVCGILYNGTPYYFIKNLQGDVIALVDKIGATVASYTYDAWGKCLAVLDANGETVTDASHIARINPFRYRGYYYDEEIGLYYLQSRYYDAEVGRFVNADEAVYIGILAPILGYDIFAYSENNAPNLNDPTGHFASELLLSKTILTSLSSALPGIMTSISASLTSIKAAITTSWFIPVCIVAAAIAVVGIVYVVNRAVALIASASQTVSAVKLKANSKGIDPNKLRNYTVYIIVKKRTTDVVYVGITKRYSSRKNEHKNRFPPNIFTMMPIATGLTKNEARTMEQTIITAYTLDTLINMINSISPRKWGTFKSEFEQMSTLILSWIDQE